MSVELVRDGAGKVTSGHLNPKGTNQWDTGRISRRRLQRAVELHLTLKCASKYGAAVATAAMDPQIPENLALLRHEFPNGVLNRVELSGPAGGPVEIESRRQWEGLTASFRSQFAGDTELAVESSDASPVDGAD